jgi:ABC-2 type transport system permease protein
LIAFAAILAMVAFVAGASFVGAEWASGGMMNLLLWRPRRLQVLWTKLAALLSGLTMLTLSAGALWTLGFWLTGRYRGTTASMTAGAWQSFALTGLRALVLILAAGAIGFALASVGRHTAMALGVVLGVGVVVQFGVGIVLSAAEVDFVEAYLLPTYAIAWMSKKLTLEDFDSCVPIPGGGCVSETFDITWQMSGGLMAAAVILLLGAALWTMRSRDIT